MISQVLGGTSVVLLITTLALGGLWQVEKVKVAELENLTGIYEAIIEKQEQTLDAQMEAAIKVADLVIKHGDRVNEIITEAAGLRVQIDRMSYTAAAEALADPFKGGNVHYDLLHAAVVRFVGPEESGSSDQVHTSDGKASNTAETNETNPSG